MPHYIMDGNEYTLTGDRGEILWRGPEIAVALSYSPEDEISGTLHKHGSTKKVREWAETVRKKYISAGLNDLAREIVVISGKIPIEDLNKMIDISGYVGAWFKKIYVV